MVLAPPIKDNEYYAEKYWDVQKFYKRYSDAILAQQEHDDDPDRVVVVSDERSYYDYVEAGVNENASSLFDSLSPTIHISNLAQKVYIKWDWVRVFQGQLKPNI